MSINTITVQNTDFATEYQPLIPPQRDNPYPIYARARKEAPVFYSPELNIWFVTRYDDISQVLKDPTRFSSVHNFDPAFPLPPEVLEVLKQGYPSIFTMVVSDPPDHTHLRGLLKQAFNPQKVTAMKSRIQEISNMLIDSFVKDGQADLVRQYTLLLPIAVMTEIIGLPFTDREIIRHWCEAIPRLLWEPLSLEQKLACAHNIVVLQHYLAAQIEERRVKPQHDMLSDLINLFRHEETLVATSEIVNLITTMLFAVYENPSKGIANTLMLMLSHPAQLQAIRENPNLSDNVLQESMRMESSIKGIFRTTNESVELGGVTIPAKARIQLMLASANRDEAHFTDPDLFDINRKHVAQKHLAFGSGIHYCVGTSLTRLLGQVTIQILLERLPNLRLQKDRDFEFTPNLFFRELKQLLVEWDVPVAASS